jgi:hypothetical protein
MAQILCRDRYSVRTELLIRRSRLNGTTLDGQDQDIRQRVRDGQHARAAVVTR